jgi:hypothetical protein
MHKYRVVERWAEESRLTLRCSRGQYHLARALNVMPEVEARLEGYSPHLGFGVLTCPKSGAVFRVIFESIGNASKPLAPNVTQVVAY